MTRDRRQTPVENWIAQSPIVHGNGRRTLFWILSALVGLAISLTAVVYENLSARVERIDRMQTERGERMSSIEAKAGESDRRFQALEVRLTRIEEKLDRLFVVYKRRD